MCNVDVVERMRQRAEAAHTIVAEVQGLAEAFRYAIGVTTTQGGFSIAATGFSEEDLAKFEWQSAQSGLRFYRNNLRDYSGKISTGFTWADWGIAETGTLVMDSTSEDLRLATMFSETHIAVLPKSRIKPDSIALEKDLSTKLIAGPRYIAFISGASRTGDIERVITLGIHGPKELHILLMEEAGS